MSRQLNPRRLLLQRGANARVRAPLIPALLLSVVSAGTALPGDPGDAPGEAGAAARGEAAASGAGGRPRGGAAWGGWGGRRGPATTAGAGSPLLARRAMARGVGPPRSPHARPLATFRSRLRRGMCGSEGWARWRCFAGWWRFWRFRCFPWTSLRRSSQGRPPLDRGWERCSMYRSSSSCSCFNPTGGGCQKRRTWRTGGGTKAPRDGSEMPVWRRGGATTTTTTVVAGTE